jgi:hypothetical protein
VIALICPNCDHRQRVVCQVYGETLVMPNCEACEAKMVGTKPARLAKLRPEPKAHYVGRHGNVIEVNFRDC